jgi:hypothetical protein
MSGAPVVALLDFPRAEHHCTLRELGAAAVFAKPYQLTLLDQELTRLANMVGSVARGLTPSLSPLIG